MDADKSVTAAASRENIRKLAYRLTRLAPVLVVVLAAAFAFRRLSNTDTWWHLASGRWIVTHRTIPFVDTLSWTVPDHPWINLQWLFDVILYGIHRVGGPSLLVVCSMTAYAAAISLTLVNIRRHVGPIMTTLLGTWVVLIAQERFEIRPEMVSYLFLPLLLWLYATGREPNSRRLWAVPAIMCLWVNSHSLFILGAFVIVCHMSGSLIADLTILPQGWRRPSEPAARKQILATGVIGLAATLINPFFITGTTFPFKLMSRINGDNPVFQSIGEFRRPFPDNPFMTFSVKAYQWFFFLAVFIVVGAMVVAALQRTTKKSTTIGNGLGRAGRRRLAREQPQNSNPSIARINLSDIAVFSGIAYLSFLAIRNIPLIAIGGAPCIAACIALLAARFSNAATSALILMKGIVAAIILVLLLGGYWFIASNSYYLWNHDLREFGLGRLDMRFPVRAAAFMKAQALPGPLYNDLQSGGYLAWVEPVPGGVYIDGRLEVYDTDFFDQYTHLLADPRMWQAEMDRRAVQTVLQFHWWGNAQRLVRYLVHDNKWALVYYDETSVLLVRREGNDEIISRAQAAFTVEREAMELAFFEPIRSWQHPMGRLRALQVYSALLDVIGRSNDAQRFRSYLAELNPDIR